MGVFLYPEQQAGAQAKRVMLAGAKLTNMENYGVQPDIFVDNKPEDTLAGRDRQLEAAVEELMKELNGSKRNTATEGQQK